MDSGYGGFQVGSSTAVVHAGRGYFAKLIAIMGKQKQYRLAMELFKEFRKCGRRPDTTLANTIMALHVEEPNKEEGFVKAQEFLGEMKLARISLPNVTYNIFVRAAAQLGHHEFVDFLFKEMFDRHISPDHYTFNGIMDAYAKAGDIERTEDILRRMRGHRLRLNNVTYNTLIDAYGKAAEFAKMELTLSCMMTTNRPRMDPSERTYNSMISSYGFAGLAGKVEWVLDLMKERNIMPTFRTSVKLIEAYGRCGEFKKMRDCMAEIVANCCRVESSILNKMLESYCGHGLFAEAEALLSNSGNKYGIEATSLSYAIVIRAYKKGGRRMEMQALLQRMKLEGFKPTKQTFLDFMEQMELAPISQKQRGRGTNGIINELDLLPILTSARDSHSKVLNSTVTMVESA